ncbi:Uncharacterised protein [Brucella abortus]|nr:Uncharacterised protein [Brucella abortus]
MRIGLKVLLLNLIFGSPCLAARLGNARATKHDDGGFDTAIGKNHFRLEQLKLQPDRAQVATGHELIVHEGKTVGGCLGLGCLRYGSRLLDRFL